NRNKRSIVLDLKQPAAHAVLLKLIAKADVFMWNVRPAAIARLKLSYEDVRKVNPKIIYCGMFGFGQKGRYRDKPAYDNAIQGLGGLAALNHRATGEPRYMPLVVADKVVGLTTVQMIAMALYRRSQTGEGFSIQIPMFENVAKFVLESLIHWASRPRPRTAGSACQPIPTSRCSRCSTRSACPNSRAIRVFPAWGGDSPMWPSTFGSVTKR
ncbi:MAG: CoA transferase, partial [Proteobacteria bacterium]|nr:CoA transferase [Pseudomonadota bacterium]